MLELANINYSVGGEPYLKDINLTLERGRMNILLGPTLSGKTSLMRLMAGLDTPSSGELLFNGKSVLGIPVQKRGVAMVYQQFINYPTLTVFENIASPLQVSKTSSAEVHRRVSEIADLLGLTDLLQRKPLTLSGGQQQRTALARALIKEAGLVLLDEPLANLDYKLREELRSELPRLFAEQNTVVVYATTEPTEALILGGHTSCLSEGRLTQTGPTLELFEAPENITTAALFSDPPLNVMENVISDGAVLSSPFASMPPLPPGRYIAALRPHSLRFEKRAATDIQVRGIVTVTEMSGSESYVHFSFAGKPWVALISGIHKVEIGTEVKLFCDTASVLFFNQETGARIASCYGAC